MRFARWVVIGAAGIVCAGVVFVVVARGQVGTPRPVGTVCAFEHDPGSGQSDVGRIEHRGWLVPHEACVHDTDGENIQPVGLMPFVTALAAMILTVGSLTAVAVWRDRSAVRTGSRG